ncbi:MAG: hypothetical protein HZB51_34235 [Chloroflexi bacterium]|nr:hypothetical protein [Chloroflexota bacterium]
MDYRFHPQDLIDEDEREQLNNKAMVPMIDGILAMDDDFDPEQVIAALTAEYNRLHALRLKAANQKIAFEKGPICAVFFADVHLGHPGVNIVRFLEELRLIRETPGMWAFAVGDMVENMILPKLVNNRFNGELKPTYEWKLLRYVMEIIAPKLIGATSGNHENWIEALTGIPYFHEIVKQTAPQVLYNTNDIQFDCYVEGANFPVRIRHKWLYKSKYNATHGIEDAWRFDHGFKIGVGAHTHTSGLIREFNAGGDNGMALLCGTYKDCDEYAAKLGVPRPNRSTAVSVILYPDGDMTGYRDLRKAADVIRRLRGN